MTPDSLRDLVDRLSDGEDLYPRDEELLREFIAAWQHDRDVIEAWRLAVDEVEAHYPVDVFRMDGVSVDARSARVARLVCQNIRETARARLIALGEKI